MGGLCHDGLGPVGDAEARCADHVEVVGTITDGHGARQRDGIG